VDEAFALLRRYARHHHLLLSDVARRVIGRDLPACLCPRSRLAPRACGTALLVGR
jgi:hypothetical protein